MRDKMTEVHGKKVEITKSSVCLGTLLFIAGTLYALQTRTTMNECAHGTKYLSKFKLLLHEREGQL